MNFGLSKVFEGSPDSDYLFFMGAVVVTFVWLLYIQRNQIILYFKNKNEFRILLDSIAQKFNGKVVVSQLHVKPLLKILVGPKEAIFSFHLERSNRFRGAALHKPAHTVIKIKQNHGFLPEFCVVKTTVAKELLLKLGVGMKDVVIGNPRFDDDFIVKSKDQTIVRNILTEDIQKCLSDLVMYSPMIHVTKDLIKLEFLFIPKTETEFAQIIKIIELIIQPR